MPSKPEPSIRVGISSCLLGEKVRFDGGHKLDRFIADTLGQFFEWVPVCPEVAAGFATPRQAIRLEESGDDVHLRTVKTGLDLTERMNKYADTRARALAKEGIIGYILKSKSPSCGMERMRIYGSGDIPAKAGLVLIVEALLAILPDLPVEEEKPLSDLRIRGNWVQLFLHFIACIDSGIHAGQFAACRLFTPSTN
jgi:uncharacterized protein YbbK (DUF523 family)